MGARAKRGRVERTHAIARPLAARRLPWTFPAIPHTPTRPPHPCKPAPLPATKRAQVAALDRLSAGTGTDNRAAFTDAAEVEGKPPSVSSLPAATQELERLGKLPTSNGVQLRSSTAPTAAQLRALRTRQLRTAPDSCSPRGAPTAQELEKLNSSGARGARAAELDAGAQELEQLPRPIAGPSAELEPWGIVERSTTRNVAVSLAPSRSSRLLLATVTPQPREGSPLRR